MAIQVEEVDAYCGWSLDGGRIYRVDLLVGSDDPIGPKAVREHLLSTYSIVVGMTYRYPLTEDATEEDVVSFLQGFDVSQGDGEDARQWKVSMSWGPRDPSKDDRGPVDPATGIRDPFAAPVELTPTTEFEDFAPVYDRNGEPLLNAAGDPVKDITVPVPMVVYEVKRVEREFQLAWLTDYQQHVNSADWLGFPAGSVLCRTIRPQRVWNEDINGWTWPTTYEFAVKAPIEATPSGGSGPVKIYPGWTYQILNAGKRYQNLVDGKKHRIIDDEGVPASEAFPLNTGGTAELADSDAPNFLYFDLLPTVDFAGLNMPADLFTAGTPAP